MQEFKKWLGNERLPVYAVNQDKKVEVIQTGLPLDMFNVNF